MCLLLVVGCRDDHIFASENRLKLAQKAQLDMQSRLDIAKEHRSHFRRNKLKLPLDADIGKGSFRSVVF